MSLHRFHVPAAAPGARVSLPDHAAHHARDVLRLRVGAPARIFDGAGNEWDGVLEEVSRRSVSARLLHAVEARPESPLRLALAMAALKGDRMELVIQKATELGVAQIWPVVTLRTDAAARPALDGSRSERWERVASGAAEQCGRAVVPHIAPTTTLDGLIARPFDGARAVLLETPGHQALASVAIGPGVPLLLLVGPAGGFEAAEAGALLAAGFVAASLGPRVLRAETAAVAAVTIAQATWGDLGR